jgi:hypothetical protein
MTKKENIIEDRLLLGFFVFCVSFLITGFGVSLTHGFYWISASNYFFGVSIVSLGLAISSVLLKFD